MSLESNNQIMINYHHYYQQQKTPAGSGLDTIYIYISKCNWHSSCTQKSDVQN